MKNRTIDILPDLEGKIGEIVMDIAKIEIAAPQIGNDFIITHSTISIILSTMARVQQIITYCVLLFGRTEEHTLKAANMILAK